MNLILSVAVVLAILSSSCFVVPPIFAFEIDQSENKHQQSIKSAAATDEAVVPAAAGEPINQAADQRQDDGESSSDEEFQSNEGPKTTLQTDLFEFIDLIPVDEVNELKVRYYVSDPKVRQAFDYLNNYNYSFVKRDLYELHEVKRAMLFFNKHEVDLNEVGGAVYDRLGPPNASFAQMEVHSTNTGGFYGLFDNILDEIPQDEVVTLFFNKMDSSPQFNELFEWIGSSDFKDMLNALRYNKDVQRFVFGLRDNGIDVVKIYRLLRNYFGFGNR